MSHMTHEMRAQLDDFKSVRVKHPRLEDVGRAVTQVIHEHARKGLDLLQEVDKLERSSI
jgi:hypothetical protein